MRQSPRYLSWPLGRGTILVAVAAAMALLSACNRVEKPRATDARPVRIIRIEQRAAHSAVVLTGTVQAQKEDQPIISHRRTVD